MVCFFRLDKIRFENLKQKKNDRDRSTILWRPTVLIIVLVVTLGLIIIGMVMLAFKTQSKIMQN